MSTIALQYAPTEVAAVSDRRAWSIVIGLGIAHMIVDSATVYTACRVSMSDTFDLRKAMWVIAAYNLLAFATQPLTGLIVDALRLPARAAAVGGFMAAGAAMICTRQPMLAIWLAAIGNSFFHVGAGSVCLQLARGRAAMPGVFVGPGDMGVIIGASLGWGWCEGLPIVIAVCIGISLVTFFVRDHERVAATSPPAAGGGTMSGWLGIAALLICLSICVRAYMGGWLTQPWLNSPGVWIGIALAAIAAKAAGGLVADRVGWLPMAAVCAVLAAPLVALRGDSRYLTVAAMFMVQAAMPITLAAIARILPGRPGLAFGLASFSIAMASPITARYGFLKDPSMPILLGVQLACAAAVVGALLIIRPQRPVVGSP